MKSAAACYADDRVKTDKIRALLPEGHLRTEVAEFVDVERGIVVVLKSRPIPKVRACIAIRSRPGHLGPSGFSEWSSPPVRRRYGETSRDGRAGLAATRARPLVL
ncbi:hypothetical protein X755_06455 [Mesorhizobium sp. LNJC405B00]|nr:hypothetical protein X755_06455 [Mesorhizobium sp. LNJC405B00]